VSEAIIKINTKQMKKIILGLLMVVFCGCKQEEKQYTIEEQIKIDSIKETILKEAENKAYKDSIAGWNYETKINKMTGTKDLFCTVQSNESLNLDFPYDGVNYGGLTVRRMNGEVDIIIAIMKGQISGGYENEYFKARFDDGKQITFSYLSPSDNSTESIFVENSSKFLKKLQTAKKVLIQLPLYQNGNQILEFNTQGLKFN
jgi:hypothetical protein